MIAQNCQALEPQNANEEHGIIIEQSTTLIKETSKMKEEHKLISQQTRSLSTKAIEWVKNIHVLHKTYHHCAKVNH